MNVTEMNPIVFYTQKGSFYPSLNARKYLMKICTYLSRIRWYSEEFSEKLTSFTTFYSHKQNARLKNYNKPKKCPISSTFSVSSMNNFGLVLFTNFELKFKTLIFGLFEFEFKLKMAKFLYRSCQIWNNINLNKNVKECICEVPNKALFKMSNSYYPSP